MAAEGALVVEGAVVVGSAAVVTSGLGAGGAPAVREAERAGEALLRFATTAGAVVPAVNGPAVNVPFGLGELTDGGAGDEAPGVSELAGTEE